MPRSLKRSPALQRFARYALVGVSTFGADLLLCLALHHWLLVPYPIAVALGFYAGMTYNYLINLRHNFMVQGQHHHKRVSL